MCQDGCVEPNQAKIGAADVLGWPGWAQSSRKWGRGCARAELNQAKNGAVDVLVWLGQAPTSQKRGRGYAGMAWSSSIKPKMGPLRDGF